MGANNDMLSYNLFAYCSNNPVNRIDPSGHFWKEIGDFFKGVGDAIGDFVGGFFEDYKTVNTYNPVSIDAVTTAAPSVKMSKKRTARPDSGLVGIPDEEISRKARDKSLSGEERNRYREEEKVRGLRNKQKRKDYKKAFSEEPFELPEVKNGLPDINGNYKSPQTSYGAPVMPNFPSVPVFP